MASPTASSGGFFARMFGSSGSNSSPSQAPSEFAPDAPDNSPSATLAFAHDAEAAPTITTTTTTTTTDTNKETKKPSPVELLFIDENPFMRPAVRPQGTFGPVPMRTGWDKVLYGTGLAYIAGLSYGTAYGLVRGLQTAQVPNFKVRLNNVVNQATRYGPWAANSLGVMVMNWAMLDNTLAWYRGGQSDYFNHISAAFLSGAFFKSTAGIRPALITGTILASVVSAYGALDIALNAPSKSSRNVTSGVSLSSSSSSSSSSPSSNTNFVGATGSQQHLQPMPAA